MVQAVRGAIQVAENSREAIYKASIKLVEEILALNIIAEEDIISILFSVTRDLNRANPATGLRTRGFSRAPLFCVQEAEMEDGLMGILRVLLTYNSSNEAAPRPVYIDGAQSLRPDLNRES